MTTTITLKSALIGSAVASLALIASGVAGFFLHKNTTDTSQFYPFWSLRGVLGPGRPSIAVPRIAAEEKGSDTTITVTLYPEGFTGAGLFKLKDKDGKETSSVHLVVENDYANVKPIPLKPCDIKDLNVGKTIQVSDKFAETGWKSVEVYPIIYFDDLFTEVTQAPISDRTLRGFGTDDDGNETLITQNARFTIKIVRK